jgi:predicted Fe-S protein YdhL (DUF1289 family)
MTEKKPLTPSEMGRLGGLKAWSGLSDDERTAIWKKRAKKGWKTRRERIRKAKKNSP